MIGFPYQGIFRWLKGSIRSVLMSRQYEIKAGYIHRSTVVHHDDSDFTDQFQKEVYLNAANLMAVKKYTSVIDIGCGSGYKLANYLGQYKTLGVDYAYVISKAATQYPEHQWLEIQEFVPEMHEADLIICADVIEHLESPIHLLDMIGRIKNWKQLLISTPERNMKRGWYHYGPPPNLGHYREWNYREFEKLIASRFKIIDHSITNLSQGTQLIICRPLAEG